MAIPETRHSLLLRMHDRADVAAWSEFCTIYEPVVYRIAKRANLQDADAREVAQEVLLIVSRKVDSFDTQASGRFRGWLSKIARHATIDLLRKRHERPIGGSDVFRMMASVPAIETEASREFLAEARSQKFHWAAEQVRQSTQSTTWQAFWLTAVESLSASDVATRLGISVGAVYVSRCRTLARIKKRIESFMEDEPS
jgi:RNA polymerase sigma-70 factor, ECF subfamily